VKIIRSGFVFVGLLILGGLSILISQEEQPQKIAIASQGETIDSQVGSQAARSPWFLFFDKKGQLAEAIENPYQQRRGDAGLKCAELLAEKGVTVFVAGNIGDKMAEALESEGIVFITFSGTVKEAIAHVLNQQDPTLRRNLKQR
jgi:predicted Fe-Mo cluster-binding NifX family protein